MYQEVGGQLSTDEAAALQRWRAATGGAAQAANSDEPWVTEQQLQEAGLLDNPYYVQVQWLRGSLGSNGCSIKRAWGCAGETHCTALHCLA